MKNRVSVSHLTCSHCAIKIEETLQRSGRFQDANLNFAAGLLIVEDEDELSEASLQYIQQVCDDIEPGVKVAYKRKAAPLNQVEGTALLHYEEHAHTEDCGCDHAAHKHSDSEACGCGDEHGTQEHSHGEECGCGHDHDHSNHLHTHTKPAAVSPAPASGTQKVLFSGLTCSNCAMKIEEALQSSGRFPSAAVNFAGGFLLIGGSVNTEDLAFIQGVCDDIEPGTKVFLPEAGTAKQNKEEEPSKRKISRNALTLIASLVFAALAFTAGRLLDIFWLAPALYVVSATLASYDVWYKGITGIPKKRVDENLLMTIAIFAAFIIGEFPEAVMVALLFKVSLFLEDKAVGATRNRINAITDIQPDTASILGAGGEITEVPAESVAVGSTIVIRPSERVPLDCVITKGETSADNSAITGESLPVDAAVGDPLPSGSINLTGLIHAKTTAGLEQSTAARIIALVEESSAQKSQSQKFITRFAAIYTPIVIALAVLVAIIPPLIGLGSFQQWVYTALVIIVSACPCALVISLPLGFVSGIGAATRQGVLIKGGKHIESLANLTDVVFDKTGTLTDGKLSIQSITAVGSMSKEEVLRTAAAAEQHSAHPISQSIVAQSGEENLPALENVREIAGQGVVAELDGRQVLCGSARLLRENGVPVPTEITANVLVAVNGQLQGYIAVGDNLRPDSKQAIKDLKASGIHTVSMLTGDSTAHASLAAQELGLDDFYAELQPADKVAQLKNIKRGGKTVAFVGDGINDAPVLAASDGGVAMGLGTDAAIEAADMVLVNSRPSALAGAVTLSKRVMRTIKANIWFALAVKAAVIVLSLFSLSTIWMAVFADVGVTVLSVLNTSRLLLAKK